MATPETPQQDEAHVYIKDIDKHCNVIESGATVNEKLEAVSELGHLTWIAGDQIQKHIFDKNPFNNMYLLLQNPNPKCQTIVLQSVSIICRRNRLIQNCMGRRWVDQIVEYLAHTEEGVRKWSALCLFYLLSGNASNQAVALKNECLQERLERVSKDNWQSWGHNDADEVLKMLGMKPPIP